MIKMGLGLMRRGRGALAALGNLVGGTGNNLVAGTGNNLVGR